jgi:hypothetical protein
VQHSKIGTPMSLMGQSRRFRALPRRSVLPPKAAVTADIRDRPFRATSGLTHRSERHSSLHNVVGDKQNLAANRQTQLFCCLQIEHQLEFGWLLYG